MAHKRLSLGERCQVDQAIWGILKVARRIERLLVIPDLCTSTCYSEHVRTCPVEVNLKCQSWPSVVIWFCAVYRCTCETLSTEVSWWVFSHRRVTNFCILVQFSSKWTKVYKILIYFHNWGNILKQWIENYGSPQNAQTKSVQVKKSWQVLHSKQMLFSMKARLGIFNRRAKKCFLSLAFQRLCRSR